MTEPDEQLMMRYREGDGAAFDTLYRRHRGPVFRYIQRLSHTGEDVESLYQDAWMRVIRAREQWDPTQPFRPWLYRIAHNRVVDAWRSARGVEIAGGEALDDAVEPSPGVDAMQLLRDCVERLMGLLAKLPEAQRSAFLLKEEAGLTLAQIGEVTGVERETVKSRLRYALKRLRDGLEGCDE
jgi:RNA polymerase sigma-70 factor (ECF subfamily)